VGRQERAEAAIALSRAQGFPFFLTLGHPTGLGAGRAGTGGRGHYPNTPGVGSLAGFADRAVPADFLALLAEGYGKAGQIEEGLTALTEALATVDRTGERYYEADCIG